MLFDGQGSPAFVDPKRDGWFVSEDAGRVELVDGRRLLFVDGRRDDLVKIGGESVDLRRLDAILERLLDELRLPIDAAIVPAIDERLGHVIHLAASGDARAAVDAFNQRVLPFERIRAVRLVQTIPRTPLGKLIRKKLLP